MAAAGRWPGSLGLLGVALVFGVGCSEPEAPPAPDGSGTAIVLPGDPVEVGSQGAWTVVYTAGPEGLPEGAGIVFHLPLFWQWTPPQATAPDAPGYVRIELPQHPRRRVRPEVNRGLHYVRMTLPCRIEPGERVILHYGSADPEHFSSVTADPFAEDDQYFRVAVDGDGDGRFADIDAPPSLRLVARPAIQLNVVVSPSLAGPGDSARVHVGPLDGFDNLDESFRDESAFFLLREPLHACGAADTIGPLGRARPGPGDRGTVLLPFVVPTEPGRYRVGVRAGGLTGRSNPFTVRANPGIRRLVWADLHGHSAISDGTGSADDYYFYARRVSGLDAAALTDHDRHGLFPLDERRWAANVAAAREHDRPGRFVTILGYEYTNWIYGHRNVYYADLEGEVYAAADTAYDTPEKLWAALEGRRAITVPHHTAGEPARVDWDHHDPALEPVVEIASVHGVSERVDAPGAVRGATPGHTVIDALNRGYRLGFIGSGDGHVGHPGRQLEPYPWGLCGLWVDSIDREGVFAALVRRSVFATTGARIVIRFSGNGVPMGGEVPVAAAGEPFLMIGEVVGTDRLEKVELVKNGAPLFVQSPQNDIHSFPFAAEDPDGIAAGDYYYLRVTQADGHMGWSSPVWGVGRTEAE